MILGDQNNNRYLFITFVFKNNNLEFIRVLQNLFQELQELMSNTASHNRIEPIMLIPPNYFNIAKIVGTEEKDNR